MFDPTYANLRLVERGAGTGFHRIHEQSRDTYVVGHRRLANVLKRNKCQRARGGGNLLDRDRFVGTVRKPGTARSIVQRRHARESGKQAEVAPVRCAPYGWLACSRYKMR